MANLKIYGIIENMTSKDRESRYMATSDLLNELNEDSLKLGTGLEMILRSIIPQQLDDVAGDVSGLAVKCLALLGKKVGEERIVEMTINLCDELLHMEDWYHDTASIALRAVVSQVASSLSPDIPFTLTPKMIEGICGQGMGTGIKCGCLSIMTDIVQKYASLMADGHDKLLNTLLVQLCCNNATVWKKTVTRIASLACSLSDDLLAKATVEVFENLSNKNAKSEITRTNIQMIEDFCHAVGYQLVAHQGSLVPVLAKYYLRGSASDEELCKSSLQALQSFLLRCPFSTYCHKILDLSLEYLTYDDTSNEYTDVFSWGVRRAATKCLRVLIVSHPEMLSKLYQEACPKLIDRFKERDKKLKMDVFNTFIALLRQTAIVTKGQTETDESSPKWLLEQEVSKIVNSITEQLREKNSVKTKVGAFSVLRELVAVLPDCLGSLVPVIERALNDKSSTSDLKIEALVFTKLILASHAPPVFHPYIKALSSPVLAAVGERYYKVTAEALRVCKELVRVIRPNTAGMGFDFKPFVHPIYNAIMLRLTNKDQDQEVKECAITCMGLVISTFGDQLRAELSSCLPVLVDHMGNENTRLTAVKAFAVIATSPLLIDISCVLDHLIAQLTGFLRKANWALGQATLVTMNTLVTAYGDKIGLDAYEAILVELSPLISVPNVPDMYMSALALKLCCTLMTGKSASENISLAVRNKVLPQALTLVKSPLLQGQALLDLKKFFEALVCHANTSFYTLLDSLVSCAMDSPESGGVPKQALYSIAQCVAVLCLATGDQNDSYTVKMLMEILKNATEKRRLNDLWQEKQQLKDRLQTRQHLKDPFKPKQHLKDPLEAKQHLALLSLGEIGRRKDLSAHAGIETIVIESFQSPFEEIKSAASYALGNIAVGNLAKYLPFILNRIDIQQKNQYFLLHSLKKVIVRQSVDKADFQNSSVEKILALLFNHCDNEDEGVRDVVAQCLGKMALIEPEKLVPALLVRTTSSAAFTRATVVTAVKYSLVEQPEKLDEIIFPEIISFLILMQDGDRHVRRAAVSALSTFARYKPNLIKGILPQLLPLLYDHTFLKKELIRTANLGPFKHVVDDGLELRKAAFECVFTLRHSCLDLVNLPFLKSGQEVEEESKVVVSDLVEFQFGGGDVEALVVYAIQLEEALMHLPILTSVTFYGHSLRSFNVNFEPHGSRIDDVPLRIDVPLAFPEEPPAVRCLTEFHGPFHLRDDGSVILDWSPGMPLSSVISELFKIWFL